MENQFSKTLALIEGMTASYDKILMRELGPSYINMTMTPKAIAKIVTMINEMMAGRPNVLELGTGLSTVALSKLCPGIRLISMDHSVRWIKLMKEKVFPAMGVSEKSLSIMLIPQDKNVGRFNVVIVDHGPKLQTRADDLPWIVKLINPRGVLVFDDWRPKHEGRIRRGLAALGKYKIEVIADTKRFANDRCIALARRAL